MLGSGREALSAIICIDKEAVGLWAELRGISYISYADLSQKPQVIALDRKSTHHVLTGIFLVRLPAMADVLEPVPHAELGRAASRIAQDESHHFQRSTRSPRSRMRSVLGWRKRWNESSVA